MQRIARETKISHASLLRGPAGVAELYLFKILQKRQSFVPKWTHQHTGDTVFGINRPFISVLPFFQPPFLRLVRGAMGPALIRLSLKKHPSVFSTVSREDAFILEHEGYPYATVCAVHGLELSTTSIKRLFRIHTNRYICCVLLIMSKRNNKTLQDVYRGRKIRENF